MAKKRKSGHRRSAASASGLDEVAADFNTRFERDETFANSEDEFFASRDEILLEEGPTRKRKKQVEEEDRFLHPSDEEVLGYNEDDYKDLDRDDLSLNEIRHSESEGEDGVQAWGISKADYYHADVIETEADALEEEAEARRLQQKQLQNMTEADFGFDETQWAQAEKNEEEERSTITQKLPELFIPEGMPAEERVNILKSKYPELEPLAKDFTELQITLRELRLAAETAFVYSKGTKSAKKRKVGIDIGGARENKNYISVLKWRALSTYLGLIAMYFALLTAPANGRDHSVIPMPPHEIREHGVMKALLRSRQSWDMVKDVPLPELAESQEETEENLDNRPLVEPVNAPAAASAEEIHAKPGKQVRKNRGIVVNAEEPVIKAKRDEKARNATGLNQNLATIDRLIARVRDDYAFKSAREDEQVDSDFGDEVALTAKEAAEKAQRKKGLRFYTSQLAQKSNKRGAASRAAGGDVDLPYKERLKDRQARLIRDAEKRRGEKAQLEQKLDSEDEEDEDDGKFDREVRGEDKVDDDGYYNMVANQSKWKKADKQARAKSYAEIAKMEGQAYVEEALGPGGKRAITYEIAKNKGLAPRRKKDVRNPRVKKRKKYDEKIKKLGSIRQVYKGGEGKGGYGGELSGIKTNIVRSVKL